jgi:DNA polymerase-3 subunit beta
MKFTVSSKVFQDSLNKIAGLIGSNSIIAILDNCLIDVKNGKLTAVSSDIENSMKIEIEVDSSENGTLAIPAKKILETLKVVPEQPLLIEMDENRKVLEIKTSNGAYTYGCFEATEFPKIPELKETSSVNIKAEALLKAINITSFALGTDEQRKAMTGLYCHFDEFGATFVSTDAQKLVKYQRKDVTIGQTFHFILPKKVLSQLKSSLNGMGEELVEVQFNKTNCSFRFGNLNVICRLIDAVYPEYNNVIPVDNPNKMTITREGILNTLRRLSPLSNQSTHQISLKIEGSSLLASALDLDFSNGGTEEQPITFVGEDMTIGFSSKYLIEILQVIDTEDVTFEMSTPNRAGLIFPVNEDEMESTMMLLMPILVNIE